MGSLSAMNSISRVLEKHGGEIIRQHEEQAPEGLRPLFGHVALENQTYSIGVFWVFKDGSALEGPSIDIDTLAEEYPDCDVGY